MEAVKAAWAKKRIDSSGQFKWLSLYDHLRDTRGIAGLIWEHWLSSGQKDYLLKNSQADDEDQIKRLYLFLAGIHDLGKLLPAFLIQEGYNSSADLKNLLLDKLEAVGFSGISELKLQFRGKTPHALAGQYLLQSYEKNGIDEGLASIIGAHHGRPAEVANEVAAQKHYVANYFQTEDENSPLYQKWTQAREEVIQWVLKETEFESLKTLPTLTQPGQVLMSGLVIMADWIASNEDYFPLLSVDQEEVLDDEKRIINGFQKWYKSQPWCPSLIESSNLFWKRFHFDSPNMIQSKLAELVNTSLDPGIFILEAPMGIGKTEAALLASELLAAKKGVGGIFFGLPTQATSNGIFPRIESWLESIVKDSEYTLGLRLLHGKASLNKDFDHLKQEALVYEEGAKVTVNEWFEGRKKAILDDFVVGTIDQFLLASLKQKHLALRHLGLSKKVLILDEIHACDAYMSVYLKRALRWMGAYDVPVILLSATLQSSRREAFIKSYLNGKKGASKQKITMDLPQKDVYPLITYSDGLCAKQFSDFELKESKKVIVKKIAEEDFIEIVIQLIKNEGVVGLIVNTVKRAQELGEIFQEKLEEDKVEVFHSRFIASQRIKKEDQLLQLIGKKAKRPKHKLIIGTQVIEQSLDINFDVLISDLAPMDSLLQRVGRLHRHDIEYPKAYQQAVLYVVGTDSEFKFSDSSEKVYGDYLLAKTQLALPDQLQLPQDISPLIQKVYSGLSENEQKNDLLRSLKQKYDKEIKDKDSKAQQYLLNKPIYQCKRDLSNTLIGLIKNEDSSQEEGTEFQREIKACAQVRDSLPTIEVIALKKIGTGYGLFGSSEDLSNQIDNNQVAKIIAQQTLNLPSFFAKGRLADTIIKELEEYRCQYLTNWKDQVWLKSSLALVFDEENHYQLGNYKLTYDWNLGLMWERM